MWDALKLHAGRWRKILGVNLTFRHLVLQCSFSLATSGAAVIFLIVVHAEFSIHAGISKFLIGSYILTWFKPNASTHDKSIQSASPHKHSTNDTTSPMFSLVTGYRKSDVTSGTEILPLALDEHVRLLHQRHATCDHGHEVTVLVDVATLIISVATLRAICKAHRATWQ